MGNIFRCCKSKVVNLNDIGVGINDILLNTTYENTNEYTYEFKKAKVIKIYDGDTFWVAAIDNGKIYRYNIRLYNVDCAEIKGGNERTKFCARVAKEYVQSRILNKIIDIEVLSNRKYGGKTMHDKYGRLLAKVSIDGSDLSDELIVRRLAKKYDGKTKIIWKDEDYYYISRFHP